MAAIAYVISAKQTIGIASVGSGDVLLWDIP